MTIAGISLKKSPELSNIFKKNLKKRNEVLTYIITRMNFKNIMTKGKKPVKEPQIIGFHVHGMPRISNL